MEYHSFGKSGLQTSRLCFGSMLLSSNGRGPWRMPAVKDEATSATLLDRYVQAGGNFIDTSNNYGESEIIIGNWLKKQSIHARRKLIICSKFASPVNTIPANAAISYPNSSGSSRKHIMNAIEDTLQNLQTKYLDVYTIHYWDDTTQLEETIRTLQNLIQMGLIRYYAVSNYTPVQLQQLLSLCQCHQWELPVFIQCQYNLLCRTAEWELIGLCKSHGIGFLAWSPLAGGWLSNRYGEQTSAQLRKAPTDSRMSFAESVHFSSWDLSTMGSNPRTWRILQICRVIATELKSTMSQVAIRWIFTRDVTGCIVGPRTLAHLEDNLSALRLQLTTRHLAMLNEASHSPPIYPYCAFAELTVASGSAVKLADNVELRMPVLNSRPTGDEAIRRLIDLSCSLVPTADRPAWMTRLIDQKVYDLAASVSPYYLSALPSFTTSSTNTISSETAKFALVFGGFLSYEEPVTTLRTIILRLEVNGAIRSFISDALYLINELLLYTKNELKVTWMDKDLNLYEWINSNLSISSDKERPSFAVCLALILTNQFTLLLCFLEFCNITLTQLKDRCIFSSGFSLGIVASHVVDISGNMEQLYRNALAAIRLVFLIGFRAAQDFRQKRLAQYATHLNKTELNLSPSHQANPSTLADFTTGSVLISGVNYRDVSDSLNVFNTNNAVDCAFDVCVVSQSDRVTVSGFAYYLPRLIEYLKTEFSSCSLTPVALDVPVHTARYFQDTVRTIVEDFSQGSVHFEGSSSQNRWGHTSFIQNSNGKPAVKMTCTELVTSILTEICRWDLVSDCLADIARITLSDMSDSEAPIVMLDFGPGTFSKNLIKNNRQLHHCIAQERMVVCPINGLPINMMTATQRVYESMIRSSRLFRNTPSSHESRSKRSIAIVGMACRFPDASSPDELYYNLLNKTRSFRQIPTERWNHHKIVDPEPKNLYKTNAQHMSLLEDIDLFDPQFFNLNIRDAKHMDPQHRLTLELCYLALENAGYVIGEGARMGFNEQKVGVFVGCSGTDSYRKNMEAHMAAQVTQCVSRSLQAGRVSYFFKFCGPAIQIDTGCSTSLVCLHLAVESVLKGECDTAVVSAVLTGTDPVEFLALAAGGVLSTGPAGGCRAFAADANGYTRADGVAAIVIKPYKAAVRDRDCIHALIDSTVINQSGHSQSLLLPSQLEIESLIQAVLLKARVPPGAIQYIEAHGTGTQAGDPIEMNAIVKMLGMDVYRSKKNPIYVGTHKAFVGHSEAAAGLAGLIKTVMMLQHKTITPHFHIDQMNPKIDLQRQQHIIIPEQARPWTLPHPGIPRRAIVNSYGISGSNASCVLQEAPAPDRNESEEPIEPVHLVTISGKQCDSVRAYCLRLIQYLASVEVKLSTDSSLSTASRLNAEVRFLRDLAYTTTVRRNHFPHRIAVVASSIKDLTRKLASVVQSMPQQLDRLRKQLGSLSSELLNPVDDNLFLSKDLQKSKNDEDMKRSNSVSARIVFIFGGQGSHHMSMYRQLLYHENTWASTFRLCSDLFAVIHPTLLPRNLTLVKLLEIAHSQVSPTRNGDCETTLDEQEFFSTEISQPLLFAVQYSLARMLISWELSPSYIIGHSVGELVGACIGSVMSLEDALFLLGHRAQLMGGTPKGAMLAINCTVDDFNNLCRVLNLNENDQIEVSIAAINSTRSLVTAGAVSVIDKLQSYIAANNLFPTKKLKVTHAFHTHHMTSILAELHSVASKIVHRESKIPVFDTLRGELRTTFNAKYWTQQLSEPVNLDAAITGLSALARKEDFRPICIELSPSAALAPYLMESNQNLETYCIMNKNRGDFEQIYNVIAGLYVNRLTSISWSELHRTNHYARVLSLPNYAFNYRSCWLKLPWIVENSVQETTTDSHIATELIADSQKLSANNFSEVIRELPLIGQCHVQSSESKNDFECFFPVFDRAWRADIQNHVVSSKGLFPIPLYIALTSQFASFAVEQIIGKPNSNEFVSVEDLMIKSPFIWSDTDLNADTCREINISLVRSKNSTKHETVAIPFHFTVSSSAHIKSYCDAKPKISVHASGTICLIDSPLANIDTIKASFDRIMKAFPHEAQNNSSRTSLSTQEFYSLATNFGIDYGPHYRSVELLVHSKGGLVSWSKQKMQTDQPYLDMSGRTLIHPSWLDSFMQAIAIQVSIVPELNKPFVAMFVQSLICRTHVNGVPNAIEANRNKSKLEITQSPVGLPVFFTESEITSSHQNRVTCDVRGFDADEKCVVLATGIIMMTVNSEFGNHSESEISLCSTQQSAEVTVSSESVINPMEQSDVLNNVAGKSYIDIQKIIVNGLCDALEIESDALDFNENFTSMGVDSLLSIEIRGHLRNALRMPNLMPTVLFDHPSVNALTSFIFSLEPMMTDQKPESDDKEEAANHVSSSSAHVVSMQATSNTEKPCNMNTNNPNCGNNMSSDSRVRALLIDLIADSLEVDASSIDDNDRFNDIGVDSLLSIEIRGNIQTILGLKLPASLIFDCPTLSDLIPFIQNQLVTHHSATDM